MVNNILLIVLAAVAVLLTRTVIYLAKSRLIGTTSLTAILAFCGATIITSCTNDNDDNNVTPNTDDVRLTRYKAVALSPIGDTLLVTTQYLTWEDGLLRRINTSIRSMQKKDPVETEDRFVYEGTNCTEIIHGTGTHDTFTYADGRMTSAVSTMSDGTVTRVNITAYTADGHVSEMTREVIDGDRIVKNSFSLSWQDGDLLSYVTHPIDPAGDDIDSEAYTYYDVPSPFTGYPMGHYIFDASEMGFRGSKHFAQTGMNAKFENGRIVAETRKATTSYFTYSDGTGN